MAANEKPRGFDVTKGIYTLVTPDEEGYMVAKDKEGVPVALYFTSADKADEYRQAIGKPDFKVLFLEGTDGVKDLTEELVDSGIKEAFLDHTKRTRQPVVLDLETWVRKNG